MSNEDLIGGAITGAIGITIMSKVMKSQKGKLIGFGKHPGVIPTIRNTLKNKRRSR